MDLVFVALPHLRNATLRSGQRATARQALGLYLLARRRLGPQHLCQGVVEFSFFHFHLTRMITGLLGLEEFRRPERSLTRSSRFQDEESDHNFHTAPLFCVKYIIAVKLSVDHILTKNR